MSGHKQLLGIALALSALVLAGCGTAMNSTSSSPSGTIQPQSQPATGLTMSNFRGYALITGKDTSGVTIASVISGLPHSLTDSVQYGREFTYTQVFTLSGSATAVGGFGVTLTNTVGTSTEATSP